MTGTDAEEPRSSPPSRLARRLRFGDAVAVGLGSMIGAGIFAAPGPAVAAAGNGALIALVVAAILAYCNATSSAQLAAIHPESGGAYTYGRRRLGRLWGFLAGWGFLVGKIASCAAIALTFGRYVAPAYARPLALAAVVGVGVLDHFGIRKTAFVTKVIVALVLAALAVCVFANLAGGSARVDRLWPIRGASAAGILRAAAILFFAFAGYARLATLGEEVIDPGRTIPRAIPTALFLTLVVYGLVLGTTLAASESGVLAGSPAPLVEGIRGGRFASLAWAARAGAGLAALGVLVSLVAGVGRTVFAMAANGDLPTWLAAVHPRHGVPHHAGLAVCAAVSVALAFLDVEDAIVLSSFTVLGYYAITNAAALTLSPDERRWPRVLGFGGLAGCFSLAASLPARAVAAGLAIFGTAAALFALRRDPRPPGDGPRSGVPPVE